MAELKTRATGASVRTFLSGVTDAGRRRECETVSRLMSKVTGEKPRMWGSSIVGFGTYRYKNAAGRSSEWMVTGFSPRKQNLTVYIMTGFDAHAPLMHKLGKYTTGKSCLYLKRLDDIDLGTLEQLLRASVDRIAGPR